MEHDIQTLDRAECARLANAIGETPETLMTIEQLRRGLCRATVIGPPAAPLATLVQPDAFPGDATAVGDDPHLLWTLLQALPGWQCIDVARDLAEPMAELITAATGQPCTRHEELFFVLEKPVEAWPQPMVRRLTVADLPAMDAATEALQMGDWRLGSAAALIADGLAAGAFAADALVAVGFTAAQGQRYVDIGIVTREDWRGRGLSTAAAALVCADIQAAGEIPVWGTSIDNLASQKVAAKLGFVEVSRRVYVCRA